MNETSWQIGNDVFRPVRFSLNLSMKFIEPEALAEPRHWRSANASSSVSLQLISIVQVEIFEHGGKMRADYGKAHLVNLSLGPKGATLSHLLSCSHYIELLRLDNPIGRSHSNLSQFLHFYLTCPKCAKSSHILSRSHYIELLKLDDPMNHEQANG